MLIYDCIFYICSFLFVCMLFFVNKMLFIIQALHYSKREVHFLSFIDKTMHKSLDYVCSFFRMSQGPRYVRHGSTGTSVYGVKYTVVSAHDGSIFLYSDCIVSPTGAMSVHKIYVNTLKRRSAGRVVIFFSRIGVYVNGYPGSAGDIIRMRVPTKAKGTLILLGNLFLAYTPLKTSISSRDVFSKWRRFPRCSLCAVVKQDLSVPVYFYDAVEFSVQDDVGGSCKGFCEMNLHSQVSLLYQLKGSQFRHVRVRSNPNRVYRLP